VASIGALIIDLIARTGGFETDMGRAARTTEKRAKEMERSISKLDSNLKKGLAGFAAGFSFAKIIDATSEAETALAALDNAVRNNGGAAGVTTKELEELSGELQRVTTFSDDAVQGAQALLLSFKQIRGDEFDRAQVAVLDLATALKKDLGSAATLVGRALADPEKGMTALSRAGVVLSDSQKKLVKDLADTGKLSEAQGILLKELEARFGGAAAAARNTFGGAIAGLKNAFGDLLEGKAGVSDATQSINGLADALSDPRFKSGADALIGKLFELTAVGVDAATALASIPGNVQNLFGFAKPISEVEELTEKLAELKKKRDAFIGSFGEEETVKKLTKQVEDAARALAAAQSTGPTARQAAAPLTVAPAVESEEFTKAREEIEKLIASTRAQAKASDEGAEAAIRFRLTQGDLADEMKILGAAGEKLAGQLIAVSRAVDVSKATEQLRELNNSLKAQTEGLADNEAQAIRYRLEFGDLAEAVKRAGDAGKDLKLQIIASADAKQQKEDLKDIESGLMAINAQILEFQNRQDEGSLLKFDKENADLVLTLRRQGDEAGLKQIETLRKLVGAQAQINQLHKEAAAIREEESANEDRIRNSLESGAITELEAMSQLDEARKRAIADLEVIYQQQKLIADESGSETLVEGTKRFAHEIENVKAQTDLLEKSIRSGLVEASSDAFTDFITGAKSAGDALDSFLVDIERQLVQLAAKQLFQKIFSAGGSSGGGTDWIGALAGFFGGGRATGGPVDAGTMYRVNEREPEFFKPNIGGKVIPLSRMPETGGSIRHSSITQNITVAGRSDLRTARQMQIEAARQQRIATARLG
jgi:hypothetical protein